MKESEIQDHLIYITNLKVQTLHSQKLRCVTAIWKNNTANISFYFNTPPSEEEWEDVSVVCSEIVAHMPKGMLEENCIILKYPKPLPNGKFIAYKRENEQ